MDPQLWVHFSCSWPFFLRPVCVFFKCSNCSQSVVMTMGVNLFWLIFKAFFDGSHLTTATPAYEHWYRRTVEPGSSIVSRTVVVAFVSSYCSSMISYLPIVEYQVLQYWTPSTLYMSTVLLEYSRRPTPVEMQYQKIVVLSSLYLMNRFVPLLVGVYTRWCYIKCTGAQVLKSCEIFMYR